MLIREGEIITIDGTTGKIYLGQIPTIQPTFSEELKTILDWADEIAELRVYANVDTPERARTAVTYGAMGIGLCRTERMFNSTERLPIMIDMILADSVAERKVALDKLFPFQRDDFQQLFQAMSPHPVTVRLLDPPMHEFLPGEQQLLDEIDALKQYEIVVKGQRVTLDMLGTMTPPVTVPFVHLDEEKIRVAIQKKELMLKKVKELFEVNPMLGHRGVRLGMSYPEIYQMQIRSILEAAASCMKQHIPVQPEIMVPQVISPQELIKVKEYVDLIRQEIERAHRIKLKFKFGSMVETVRACTRAGPLAEVAEFFSFGTNDLTQETFSFSREDAENKFLPLYNESGLLNDNPFEVLDVNGVGELMKMTTQLGRETRPNMKIGICGEQGGHPRSIRFCHHIKLDYVSCSSPRIPIARLASAHAKLLENEYSEK